VAHVFVTGGTGFLGSRLIARLLDRGHTISAVARPGSEAKLPKGTGIVTGDPLHHESFASYVPPAHTFIHLVGTAKPTPWKGAEFRAVDQVSLEQSLRAAKEFGIQHFVYVSVAQPAPVMQPYIEVRQECERLIRESGIGATILRPWYILGPGRNWPQLLKPLYWLLGTINAEGAARLGLVTLDQMLSALVWSVEHPGPRILDVPAIRSMKSV
jgi:uncharacterized protein YbjT (DUF2867 family)